MKFEARNSKPVLSYVEGFEQSQMVKNKACGVTSAEGRGFPLDTRPSFSDFSAEPGFDIRIPDFHPSGRKCLELMLLNISNGRIQ